MAGSDCWAHEMVQQSQQYYQIQPNRNVSLWPKVMVFVSTSMPKSALQQWAMQAEKIGAPLYLRGFVKNSVRKTVAKTMQIFGNAEVSGFEIHPEAFRNFNIKSVPAVVLIKKEFPQKENEEERLPEFDVLYGNVGLEQALEIFERDGDLTNRAQAKQLLQQVRHHD